MLRGLRPLAARGARETGTFLFFLLLVFLLFNDVCCIVSGNTQAALFNESDSGYDVLVASDAVGMGLNLNIRRIVFEALEKYDGKQVAPLAPTQAHTRLARSVCNVTDAFGLTLLGASNCRACGALQESVSTRRGAVYRICNDMDVALIVCMYMRLQVTCLSPGDMTYLHEALAEKPRQLKVSGLWRMFFVFDSNRSCLCVQTAGLAPMYETLELFADRLQESRLSVVLVCLLFNCHCQTGIRCLFRLCVRVCASVLFVLRCRIRLRKWRS